MFGITYLNNIFISKAFITRFFTHKIFIFYVNAQCPSPTCVERSQNSDFF